MCFLYSAEGEGSATKRGLNNSRRNRMGKLTVPEGAKDQPLFSPSHNLAFEGLDNEHVVAVRL
jgi:hypothetical protein